MLLGDFNCVLNTDERVSSAVRLNEIAAFKDCMNDCKMQDIKSSGNFFTWNNKHEGNKSVFSKLDRVLANEEWLETYDNAEVCYMNEGDFDHCPDS